MFYPILSAGDPAVVTPVSGPAQLKHYTAAAMLSYVTRLSCATRRSGMGLVSSGGMTITRRVTRTFHTYIASLNIFNRYIDIGVV